MEYFYCLLIRTTYELIKLGLVRSRLVVMLSVYFVCIVSEIIRVFFI